MIKCSTQEKKLSMQVIIITYVYSRQFLKQKPLVGPSKQLKQIINNYWTKFNKISWFFSEQISYLSKQILITSWQVKEAICHFSLENVVPIRHEENIICSKARLDGTKHEQIIICRQLFAGYVVGFRPMERKKKCMEW